MMKKIFAVLVSLLFVVSVFGFASVMATPPTCELPSFTSVQVGDTFTLINPYEPCDGYYNGCVDVKYLGDGVYQFKALKPGKVTFTCTGSCNTGTATVIILPKEYPMASFMKILGFGKKK